MTQEENHNWIVVWVLLLIAMLTMLFGSIWGSLLMGAYRSYLHPEWNILQRDILFYDIFLSGTLWGIVVLVGLMLVFIGATFIVTRGEVVFFYMEALVHFFEKNPLYHIMRYDPTETGFVVPPTPLSPIPLPLTTIREPTDKDRISIAVVCATFGLIVSVTLFIFVDVYDYLDIKLWKYASPTANAGHVQEAVKNQIGGGADKGVAEQPGEKAKNRKDLAVAMTATFNAITTYIEKLKTVEQREKAVAEKEKTIDSREQNAATALSTAKDNAATAQLALATATNKENSAISKFREAQQMRDAAVKKEGELDAIIAERVLDAEKRAAAALERAREADQNFKRLESMIKPGTPFQFPLEDHERNNQTLRQRNEPTQPASSVTTPLPENSKTTQMERTTEEILRDITWRWCLEKELGVGKEIRGVLYEGKQPIGEVTGKMRTGYRAAIQGTPLSERELAQYPFPLETYYGAFPRRYPQPVPQKPFPDIRFPVFNSVSPSEDTVSLQPVWFWEEWDAYRTEQEKNVDAPPGTYTLAKNEVPLHEERLNRRFMLAQVPVTQELWESVKGNNPSHFKGSQRPVENVTWEECRKFIAKLNEMRNELGVPSNYEFVLPWEAEWEHACRTGATNAFGEKLDITKALTPFHFGLTLDSTLANYNSNRRFYTKENRYLGGTSVVGKYPANPWGLHDMHGNVWEWCQDAGGYGPLSVKREYAEGDPAEEGRLPNIVDNFYSRNESILDGFYRSRRGGSWATFAENSHSAYRSFGNPLERHDDVGLRLCLAATQ